MSHPMATFRTNVLSHCLKKAVAVFPGSVFYGIILWVACTEIAFRRRVRQQADGRQIFCKSDYTIHRYTNNIFIYDFTQNRGAISLNGPAVPLGTGDRGFALLEEAGAGRNILKIK